MVRVSLGVLLTVSVRADRFLASFTQSQCLCASLDSTKLGRALVLALQRSSTVSVCYLPTGIHSLKRLSSIFIEAPMQGQKSASKSGQQSSRASGHEPPAKRIKREAGASASAAAPPLVCDVCQKTSEEHASKTVRQVRESVRFDSLLLQLCQLTWIHEAQD